jgi:DMSO/TMAO reductase YedYZ molybdopterin-dependent catalytic subunit
MAITSRLLRERGKRQAEKLGVDPQRVPPGQYLTERFPVLTVGANPAYDLATWDFAVFGEVENELTLSWDELQALPQTEVRTDIHCVTRWSKLGTTWTGVSVDTLLDAADTSAEYLTAWSDGDYTTNLAVQDVTGGQAWVAYEFEGEPLEPEHGGPARLLVPHLYFWKSAKWVRGLVLTTDDQPGFWEGFGYHNHGDPWREERYWSD